MHASAAIRADQRARSATVVASRSNQMKLACITRDILLTASQNAILEAPQPVAARPFEHAQRHPGDNPHGSLGSSEIHLTRLLAIKSSSATSLSLLRSVTNHATTSLYSTSTKSSTNIDPMASSSSTPATTTTSGPNWDGVRKKNAKIYIPEERDVATIERMMKDCTSDELLKELRMHKRLLTNRQAALRSRTAKKLKMEELEHQNQELLVKTTFWENRCRQVQNALTRDNNALRAENSELKSRQQSWSLPLSPRDTPTVASSHLAGAGYMDYTTSSSDHMMLANSGYGTVASHHQPRDGSMSGHNMLQTEVYYPTYGTINPQHITAGLATTVLEDSDELETLPGTLY